MLILTCRVGEVLTIGEAVKVTVLGSPGIRIKLAIEAPKEVRLRRQEAALRAVRLANSDPLADEALADLILSSVLPV